MVATSGSCRSAFGGRVVLIGSTSKKPSLLAVRRIKRALYDALELPEDALITVVQLACFERDCAPVETVIGLLRPGVPQVQYKIHKPTDCIDAEDLMKIAETWSFSAKSPLTKPIERDVE